MTTEKATNLAGMRFSKNVSSSNKTIILKIIKIYQGWWSIYEIEYKDKSAGTIGEAQVLYHMQN